MEGYKYCVNHLMLCNKPKRSGLKSNHHHPFSQFPTVRSQGVSWCGNSGSVSGEMKSHQLRLQYPWDEGCVPKEVKPHGWEVAAGLCPLHVDFFQSCLSVLMAWLLAPPKLVIPETQQRLPRLLWPRFGSLIMSRALLGHLVYSLFIVGGDIQGCEYQKLGLLEES